MRRTSGEVESAVFTVYRALRKSIFYEELASAIGNVALPSYAVCQSPYAETEPA